MPTSEWPTAPSIQVQQLTEQAIAQAHELELLREGFADLALAAEDKDWLRLGAAAEDAFDRRGIGQIASNCRVMTVASPLLKRGKQLRAGYVWGQGVEVQARAGAKAVQDVNAVIQAFWDDESNQTAFTSSLAQEENEGVLYSDGNFFLAAFTNPLTGRVQVRSTPFDEIVDVITNPEDRDDPWFYVREYTTTVIRPFRDAKGVLSTRARAQVIKELHPAMGYRPRVRAKAIDVEGTTMPVKWDAPMLHVPVNRLDGWKFGIPDAYASLPWARAYEGFLTDWARLVKALSKFAWRLSGDRASKAKRAASAIGAAMPAGVPPLGVQTSDAGQVAAYGPGAQLEAIPKTGATIDSESGRPLAAIAAAGIGIPVTTLLADPGTTGARATAETLREPLVREMGMRRSLWGSVIKTLASYVIDQAVKAPRGPLRGTVSRDEDDREVVTLVGEVERTVEVVWPSFDEIDIAGMVAAIVDAESTKVLPPREIAKLLLAAFQVEDADELIEGLFDDDGQWADGEGPTVGAGAEAMRRFRRGEDPADADREDDDS